MATDNRSMPVLADLILQLGRATHDYVFGLSPAQWSALRYLARANRFSRTVSAFADYHGTTRGTASQTVKSLVRQGYVRKTRSADDGRSFVLDLTPAGRELLDHDPCTALVQAAGELPPGIRAQTTNGLKRLLAALETREAVRPFGTCGDCAFLSIRGEHGDDASDAEGPRAECTLKHAALKDTDLCLVCADFRTMRARARGR